MRWRHWGTPGGGSGSPRRCWCPAPVASSPSGGGSREGAPQVPRARCQPQGTSRCVRHSRHRPPGHNLPGPISAAAPQPRLRGPDLIPAQPPLGGQGNPSASRRDGAARGHRAGVQGDGEPGNGVPRAWKGPEWNGQRMERLGTGCQGDGEPRDGVARMESPGMRCMEDGETGNGMH